MARCKDCIHYEICDEYVSPCESFPETDGCKCFKTAEEVKLDRAMSLMEKFLLEDQEARNNALMAEHDREVARKIFEDLELLMKIYTFPVVKLGVIEIVKEPFWCIEPNDFTTIKKKYTESEDKP